MLVQARRGIALGKRYLEIGLDKEYNKEMNEKWIFAVSQTDGFSPECLTDLKNLDNLEYADVRGGEYQLWHWPTGDIFEIQSDREVESRNEYSVSYNTKGVVWLPVLKKVDNNRVRVNEAYMSLSETSI